MRWLGNVLHLLTGGLLLASAWLAAGIVLFPFPETRRLAGPCFQLALFQLWPGNKEVIRDSRLAAYQAYVRSGQLPGRTGGASWPNGQLRTQFVLWAPIGLVLAAAHLVHGCVFATVRLSFSWRSPSLSVLHACMFPGDCRVAASCAARSRLFSASGTRFRRIGSERRPGSGQLASRRLKPALLGAALVIWATAIADEPMLVTLAAPLDDRTFAAQSAYLIGGFATAASGQITRPSAMPPLPVGIVAAAAETTDTCGTHAVKASLPGLSRRHLTFALPLGSRQIAPDRGGMTSRPLRHLGNLDRFAASVKNARLRRQPCSKMVAGHAIRSAGFVADRAVFFRLAAKAAPEDVGFAGRMAQPAPQSVLQQGRILRVHTLLASLSPAKAPNDRGVEEMAARIARAGSIL